MYEGLYTCKIEDYVEPAMLSLQSCQLCVLNCSDKLKWFDAIKPQSAQNEADTSR